MTEKRKVFGGRVGFDYAPQEVEDQPAATVDPQTVPVTLKDHFTIDGVKHLPGETVIVSKAIVAWMQKNNIA